MAIETEISNGVLTVTKEFPHPIAAVFDAWIDAAKTSHWWGCGLTTKVTSQVEPKLGGKYHHLMHIEGVGDHQIAGMFTEFDPPNRLAYRMPASDIAPAMQVQVDFEATGSSTRVRLQQSELADDMKDIVAAGWTASFERLAEFFGGMRRAA